MEKKEIDIIEMSIKEIKAYQFFRFFCNIFKYFFLPFSRLTKLSKIPHFL